MMQLTEDYCSFEVAILLKKKGFDWPCHYSYHSVRVGTPSELVRPTYHNKMKNFNGAEYERLRTEWYSAPTPQMVMKWLRENYGYHITIEVMKDADEITHWFFKIFLIQSGNLCYVSGENWGENGEYDFCGGEYDSYDDAELSALKYVLENLI